MASGADFLLVQLAAVFVVAKAAGYVASLARVPPLVGEILAGVALANTAASGWLHIADGGEFLGAFAELGVIFLVFTVGLETDLKALLRVGHVAVPTALLGVLVPFALGAALFGALGYPRTEALFVGVAMVATSVGITARVLGDMGALETVAGRVILGAAVLDDVLGLLVLTVVSGLVAQGAVSPLEVGVILATALAFFLLAAAIGRGIVRLTFFRAKPSPPSHWAAFAHRADFPVVLAIGLCLMLSALATQFGLAAIVGAFLAGLLFDAGPSEGELPRRIETITALLAPFFFVFIGLSVDMAALLAVAPLAAAATAVALLGKVVGCGLGSLRLGKRTALAVGIGMAPRGEVGIIVALLGLNLGIIHEEVFGVVVAMSVLTTVAAPPLLQWAIRRTGPTPRR